MVPLVTGTCDALAVVKKKRIPIFPYKHGDMKTKAPRKAIEGCVEVFETLCTYFKYAKVANFFQNIQ